MKRNPTHSPAKRLTALFISLVLMLGFFNFPGIMPNVQAAEEELYTYTISFSHQRTNSGSSADTAEMKLNQIDKAGNRIEFPAKFEVVPGSNNAIRRAVIQSESPSLTLELVRNGSPLSTDSGVGVFADGRFVVSAEYPDVYISRITRAVYHMTWDGEDTVTTTILKDNDSEMTVYYGGKSAKGGTAAPIAEELVPNGGGDTTGLYQVSLDIQDVNFEAGYAMGFKVRSKVNYNDGANIDVMTIFGARATDVSTSSGNNALFTLRRYEIEKPSTLYTYTIDLFKADGSLVTDTPILKDMERNEAIIPKVNDRTNFKSLTFTSEYDKVTVQMSGIGFNTEVWGAYNLDNGDKRVAMTSEYNHVYLNSGTRATFYITATKLGNFRFTCIRDGVGSTVADPVDAWASMRLYYNVPPSDTGAGGEELGGSVKVTPLSQELVPHGAADENKRQEYIDSDVTFPPQTVIQFSTRGRVTHNGSTGTNTILGRNASGASHPKYAEFTMPINDDVSGNTLTLKVEKDDDDPDIEIIGKFEGNDKVNLSVAEIPGYRFMGWSAEGGSFSDSKSLSTQYTMPFTEATVIASFKKLYTITLTDAVSSTTKAIKGERLTITADNKRADGQRFKEWTATGITLSNNQKITNPLSFTMPASNITLTAAYEAVLGETFSVTVTNGTATVGGTAVDCAATGEKVTATAEDRNHEDKRFKEWTATGITLTDAQKISPVIAFTMPDGVVTLTAVYEPIPVYYTYTVDIFNYAPDNPPALYDVSGGGEGTLIDAAYNTSAGVANGFIRLSFTSTSDMLTVRAKNSMEDSGPFGNGQFVLTSEYPRVYLVGGNLHTTVQSESALNPPIIFYTTTTDDGNLKLTAIKSQSGAVSMTYWSTPTGDKKITGNAEGIPLSKTPELIPSEAVQSTVDNLKVFTVTSTDVFATGTAVWFYTRTDFGNGAESIFSSNPTNTALGGSNKNANYTVPAASLPQDKETGHSGEGQYTYTIDLFGTTDSIPSFWDMERDEPISAKARTTWTNGYRRVVMEFKSDHNNITVELCGEGFDGTVWGAYNRHVALTPEYSNAYYYTKCSTY